MNKKEQSDKEKKEGVYLPLPDIEGYLIFDDIEKGCLRVKVKDFSATVKKMLGVDFRKASSLIIEKDDKEE